MFVSAALNLLVSHRLFVVGRETVSVALQADAWHLRTDVYTSAGVMAGLGIMWLGRLLWPQVDLSWIDPVAALAVALLILHAAYELTISTARDLLDASLPAGEEQWIREYIARLHPTVRGFHRLRTRKAGATRFIEFHLIVESGMSVEDANRISEVITCDIGDLKIYDQDCTQRDKVVEVIRYARPDVIITHSPTDYMPDHVAVSRLAFDASFAASVPHYETAEKRAAEITPIYYMDTLAGINFQPTEYVDISDTMEIKLQMLESHVSQMKWMRDHDNIDFAEFVRSCARFRGIQCGVQYAEAFTQCYAWPKILPRRMLP
jgi:hypothetical protein